MPALMSKPKSSCVGPSCGGCSSANCMAEGGSVHDSSHRRDHEKGINKPSMPGSGRSDAGAALHPAFSVHEDIDKDVAKRRHHKVLGELRSMPKPKLMAEGGEVDSPEPSEEMPDEDGEIQEMLGEELMKAFEHKDKKAIMSAIEACVLQCLNKE